MLNSFRALLGLLSLVAGIFLLAWLVHGQLQRKARQSSSRGAKAAMSKKFAGMCDTYMKDSLALSPVSASQVGYHKHFNRATGRWIELDAQLDDMSSESIARQRKFYLSWQSRFRRQTPLASLGAEDAADWQLIADQIEWQLLLLDKIQDYRYNPTLVVELIGNSIFHLLSEDYAPMNVRLRHIFSRVKQVPRLLTQAKLQLCDADPIFMQTAIAENAGNIELIEKTLQEAAGGVLQLQSELKAVAVPAVAALKEFSQWLQNDLAKRPASHTWRFGKQLYDAKFRLVMECNATPEEVLSDAQDQLKAVRQEMLELALPLHRQMYPGHTDHANLGYEQRVNLVVAEVLERISDEHPHRDGLQQAIEGDLESIKQFVADKHIVSLGPRDNLKVRPTPLFLHGQLSVAAFSPAPPLNPEAEAQYWVTPIGPDVPEAQAESKLREYNNFTLKWLSIHEALPGHYVQCEHANNIEPQWRRLLRFVYGNGAYVEGWAEYIAQVMMDEGFMHNCPRFRLVMKKIRLRVLANSILDIKLHTQGMTDDVAIELMTKQAFQTQAEAAGKLRRAKLSCVQLCTYFVGLRSWLLFRQRYQAHAGKDFDMLKFHDRALAEGPLPVPVVEKLVTRSAS